jgi:Peptidase M15
MSSTLPPPSTLRAPVAPSQEPATSSETTLAALKQPDTVGETKPAWSEYTPGRAAFHVKFNGERLLYRLNSAFVLPGDEIFVEVVDADAQRKNDYTFRATLEKERQLGPTRWYWNVKVQRARSNTTVTLNIFVMVPLDRIEDGMLNGYRIGQYPTVALRQQAIYTPPRGLIEVTRENENMLVSPHFCLRQFLCKQESDYPKYLALDARLLTALELLLEKANARGYHARSFTVMSGYRTPYYNRAIGNSTRYSRHLWGDAADIFIDENPADGRMDDLNQDGTVDSHDAEVMYDLIESEYDSRYQKLLVGGLARYRETSAHGPFVHVDVRGIASRWGAGSAARGTTPSTLPVALHNGDLSHQPSYWEQGREADSAP